MSKQPPALENAWTAWCDELKRAGEDILSGDMSEADKAEGLRWLTRLTRYGLEAGLEFANPDAPAFYKPTHETVKIMSDNPDALHLMATIRDDGDYVLHGTRGTCPRLMFTTLSRSPEGMKQLTSIDSDALKVDADGKFQIHVARDPEGDSQLALKDGAQSLLIRILFHDRRAETPPVVRLERQGTRTPPAPFSAAEFAQKLSLAKTITHRTATAIQAYGDEMRARGDVNMFGPSPSTWAAGDPGVTYRHGTWALSEDEALIIELTPPEADFWNLQINNRWSESLDYLGRSAHFNAHTATAEGDGTVRLILAHQNPGLPNWLDSEGHLNGMMVLRAMGAKTDPVITCRTIKQDDIGRT